MADLFEEVEEQLRSDRYRNLFRRALPWILAVAAAALVAAAAWWGFDRWQRQSIVEASQAYAQGVTAFDAGDSAGARTRWTEVSKSRAGGYKALALMQLGGLELADRKVDAAVAQFDAAAEAAPDPVLGDVARLKSAFALMDTAAFKDTEARLRPLMEEGRPYRVQAREALAFAKLMNNDTAGARGDFVVISGLLDAPEGARARAKAAVDLIDSGSAKSVAATARAAAALPPPLPMPAGLPPGLVLPPQAQAPAPQ